MGHRLQTEAPPAAMAGCALAIGLVLLAIGALPAYVATREPPDERWFYFIFAGGFIAVGLLMVYSGIHRFLAMKTPQTIVEMDTPTLERGRTAGFRFHQPGPVALQSLRANLVGEEQWSTTVHRNGVRERRWHTQHLATINFLDHGPAEVGHEALEIVASLEVPPDIAVTRAPHGEDDRSISWKVEVWGRVRGRADFMHGFPVTVE